MKRKLAILLWSASPEQAQLCAAPFIYAAAGAALDAEVEVHFSGVSVRLLVAGVAAGLPLAAEPETSLYDLMRQAAELKVRFFACSMAMHAHVGVHETMIPEYAGAAGATAFVQRSLDPEWTTLVF